MQALPGRLHLLDGAFEWLEEQIKTKGSIRYSVALECLPAVSDLRGDLVKALADSWEDATPGLIGNLLHGQQHLHQDIVMKFIRRIEFFDIYGEDEHLALMGRSSAINPLIRIIKEAKKGAVVTNAGHALEWQKNLDDTSVDCLSPLLATNSSGVCEEELVDVRALTAARVLCLQSELPIHVILALHDFIDRGQGKEKWVKLESLWQNRPVEQFYSHLESFFPSRADKILRQVLLKHDVDKITPAYIDGGSLWFCASDGSLRQHCLKDEAAVRKHFLEAQKLAGLPEWAWIRQSGEIYSAGV